MYKVNTNKKTINAKIDTAVKIFFFLVFLSGVIIKFYLLKKEQILKTNIKLNIFIYSLIMLPVIVLPYIIGFVSLVFLIPSLILTLYYNFLCFELYNFKKNKFNAKKAKSIFGYSILYLFLIFVLFLIDKIL